MQGKYATGENESEEKKKKAKRKENEKVGGRGLGRKYREEGRGRKGERGRMEVRLSARMDLDNRYYAGLRSQAATGEGRRDRPHQPLAPRPSPRRCGVLPVRLFRHSLILKRNLALQKVLWIMYFLPFFLFFTLFIFRDVYFFPTLKQTFCPRVRHCPDIHKVF